MPKPLKNGFALCVLTAEPEVFVTNVPRSGRGITSVPLQFALMPWRRYSIFSLLQKPH